MMERYETRNENDTRSVASEFSRTLKPGDIVALEGALGAGKTVFVKGITQAFGVRERVTSPTFTLINEYRGEHVIYHMDFYRLNTPEEIRDIGVEDYFYNSGICLVEWAEKMGDIYPETAIKVSIRHTGDNSREITIERPGG